MALRGLVLPISGNPRALLESFKVSEHAAQQFSREIGKTGVSAKQAAQLQVQAAVKSESRLRSQIVEYKRLAAAAQHGSREQVAAANLAARAEQRLSHELGETAAKSRVLSVSSHRAERDLGRAGRGALAGAGIFKGLGRSLAFASGGFLAFASAGQFIRGSIDAAVEAAATQKQLGAQFRASGKNADEYRGQIDAASNKVSLLAGFTRDELTRAFITAYRGSQSVNVGLRIQAISADVARGRHIGLSQATLALTKAYGGQSTALRRLGILVPTNLKGMKALEFVAGRFAGQARAGTTAQQRFAASFHNFQEVIGTGVLPTFNHLLNTAARWLGNSRNQQRVQRDVNNALRTSGRVLHGVLAVVRPLSHAVVVLSHALGGAKNVAKLMAAVFIGMKVLKWAAEFRVLAASIRGVAAAEALAGGGGLLGGAGGLGRKLLLAAAIRGGAAGGAAALGAGGLAAGAGVAGVVLSAGGATEQHGDRRKKYPRLWAVFQKASRGGKLTPAERAALAVLGSESFASAPDGLLREAARVLTLTGVRGSSGAAASESPGRAGGAAIGTTGADAAGASRGGGGGRARHASLNYQISLAQEQLAKDELTASTKDDRATLQRLAALTRQKIAKTHDLQQRTQLYQELGGYESQLAGLEQKTAATRKQHASVEKKARADQLKALQEREKTLRGRIKDIQGSFKDAIDTAREGIGELFGGPVLNPSDAVNKGILGVTGGGGATNVKTLTADLNAQVNQAAAFQKDLALLKKRGAPAELLKELRAQGVAGAPQVAALAHASPKELAAFEKAFARREHLAIRTARTTMRAQLVTLHAARVQLRLTRGQERALGNDKPIVVKIEGDLAPLVKKVTVQQHHRDKNNASSRRGRNAGRG